MFVKCSGYIANINLYLEHFSNTSSSMSTPVLKIKLDTIDINILCQKQNSETIEDKLMCLQGIKSYEIKKA